MPTYSPATLARVAVTAEVIPENTIRVLDHGFVRLDDAMADDLSVVNGARVSFARRKEEMDESDEGLIRFLMRERHGTPFEHNSFRFHVRCPIFVAREWFRHRVGSFNEFSMRYARATDEFYVPAARGRAHPGRQAGRRTRSSRSTASSPSRRARSCRRSTRPPTRPTSSWSSWASRASSRAAVLPVGAYTEFYWTVNARSLMNFVSLRNAETAQREIRRYAEACEQFLGEQMPVTYAAFVANDRDAP